MSSVYITVGICAVILGLWLFFMIRWTDKSVSQGPALLTMVGIGGTFLGIAMGLASFNVLDVQASIPGLIAGIKTAIWASFTGVLLAILLKIRYAFDSKLDSIDSAVDNDPVAFELRALRKSLSGDDDDAVISQMKLGRMDMNQRLDKIHKSQEDFMNKLAELTSKALIEALREVIADFNAKINEQFGENFKQLNEAVGRLLVWQEQYKTQLDDLIVAEKSSVTQMSAAVDQYKEALLSTQSLLKVADDFRSILSTVDAYKANLAENTERLSSVVETMRSATPALRSEIEGLVKAVSDSIVRNEAEVERIGTEISARFQAASDAIQNNLTTSLIAANKEVNDNMSRLVGSTKEFTEALQTGLEDSLTTSLDTLSAQLTSVSRRFADDYGPIADRLRAVVSASV